MWQNQWFWIEKPESRSQKNEIFVFPQPHIFMPVSHFDWLKWIIVQNRNARITNEGLSYLSKGLKRLKSLCAVNLQFYEYVSFSNKFVNFMAGVPPSQAKDWRNLDKVLKDWVHCRSSSWHSQSNFGSIVFFDLVIAVTK